MRILWLSVNEGLYQTDKDNKGYHGGGWISSLQKLLIQSEGNFLALAYVTHKSLKKECQNQTIYYPIYESPKTFLKKIKEYYGGYKKNNPNKYLNQIEQIIQDFNPDVIHLFGLENPLSNILGNTSIPIVVHLQGLLGPSNNAFFPVGFNKSSFIFPFSIRELVIRNGYIFAKNSIHVRGERELSLFKKMKYVMGRTKWDKQVSQLLSPQSRYYHVDEVLREPFYENAGKWKYPNINELRIISTLSNTVYKGLDFVLKTAKLLKTQSDIQFKWEIVGISPNDPIVRFFERKLHINGKSVNVEYIGVQNACMLCSKLLNSHIYVHPSYIDNSPNSVCEAQLLGVPVIGTFVGGIPSLIKNGKTGFLVPANAPFETAYLLKNSFEDKDFLINIGTNGYEVAKTRHDKRKILESLLYTYQDVIKQNNISYDTL